MINSEASTITYKALSGLAPGYLSNLFTKNSAREINMNLFNATADVFISWVKTCSEQKLYLFEVQRLGMSCLWMSNKHLP